MWYQGDDWYRQKQEDAYNAIRAAGIFDDESRSGDLPCPRDVGEGLLGACLAERERRVLAEFGDMPIEALDDLQDVLETRWTLTDTLPHLEPGGE